MAWTLTGSNLWLEPSDGCDSPASSPVFSNWINELHGKGRVRQCKEWRIFLRRCCLFWINFKCSSHTLFAWSAARLADWMVCSCKREGGRCWQRSANGRGGIEGNTQRTQGWMVEWCRQVASKSYFVWCTGLVVSPCFPWLANLWNLWHTCFVARGFR